VEAKYVPRCDTVGDITKLVLAIEVDKIPQDRRPDKLRVELSDTVDLIRADNSKVGHADVLRLAFLDQRHSRQLLLIARELALDGLEESPVEVVDYLEVSGEELLHERDGPPFQSFGQHGMVGEGKGLRDDIPGVFPVNFLLCMITSGVKSVLVCYSGPYHRPRFSSIRG